VAVPNIAVTTSPAASGAVTVNRIPSGPTASTKVKNEQQSNSAAASRASSTATSGSWS
jgi:hypothetical protein